MLLQGQPVNQIAAALLQVVYKECMICQMVCKWSNACQSDCSYFVKQIAFKGMQGMVQPYNANEGQNLLFLIGRKCS